jgi:hypothetical protein
MEQSYSSEQLRVPSTVFGGHGGGGGGGGSWCYMARRPWLPGYKFEVANRKSRLVCGGGVRGVVVVSGLSTLDRKSGCLPFRHATQDAEGFGGQTDSVAGPPLTPWW